MPNQFDERIETYNDKPEEPYDPVARRLFVIITSALVLSIAVVEIWFWAS